LIFGTGEEEPIGKLSLLLSVNCTALIIFYRKKFLQNISLYKPYEFTGLLVEHEMIDVAIPTRADIKYYSRQILEAHLKPE